MKPEINLSRFLALSQAKFIWLRFDKVLNKHDVVTTLETDA